ncbi:MAG: AIR carboxylase family protein, partial [Phycisphaerae bacterium]
MKKSTKRFNPTWILAGVVAATLAQSASAVNWTGGGGHRLWNDPNSWGGTLPASGADLQFADGNQNNANFTFNNLPAGNIYGSITLVDSDTLLGNSIVLNGNVTIARYIAGMVGTINLNMDNVGHTTAYTTYTNCRAVNNLVINGILRGAGCLTIGAAPGSGSRFSAGVVCAGTSDLSVADEAAVTLASFGQRVERVTDVGVAGLERLLGELDRLRACGVLIVVAGMEGALPSVVAGLVRRPVIAVPTSVGYGANLGGIAALLG